MTGEQAPKLQHGAIPYRRRAGGSIEIMLITSRETGRWIVPKGWPIPGLGPRGSAMREAMEEAGLVGQIGEQAIGFYHYKKRLADGSDIPCAVEIFPLEVEEQLPSWPEQDQRRTKWFTLQDAAAAVLEPELSAMILALGRLVG